MRLLQLLRLAVILRLSLALLEPPIRIKPRYVAPRASLTAAGAARRLNHLQGHVAPTPGDVVVLPSHLRETELRARGGVHFNVTLVGDTWVAGLGVEQELTELWLREVRPPAIYSRRGELLRDGDPGLHLSGGLGGHHAPPVGVRGGAGPNRIEDALVLT